MIKNLSIENNEKQVWLCFKGTGIFPNPKVSSYRPEKIVTFPKDLTSNDIFTDDLFRAINNENKHQKNFELESIKFVPYVDGGDFYDHFEIKYSYDQCKPNDTLAKYYVTEKWERRYNYQEFV